MIIPDVIHYKMSSIFKIVRTDCDLSAIPVGASNLYGIDVNAKNFRMLNIRISSSDNNIEFDLFINENDTTIIDSNSLVIIKNIVPPFLEDNLNIYGVNQKDKTSDICDHIFLNIVNTGTNLINGLSFSITIEKLSGGK